jgi:hypothetical protein
MQNNIALKRNENNDAKLCEMVLKNPKHKESERMRKSCKMDILPKKISTI